MMKGQLWCTGKGFLHVMSRNFSKEIVESSSLFSRPSVATKMAFPSLHDASIAYRSLSYIFYIIIPLRKLFHKEVTWHTSKLIHKSDKWHLDWTNLTENNLRTIKFTITKWPSACPRNSRREDLVFSMTWSYLLNSRIFDEDRQISMSNLQHWTYG